MSELKSVSNGVQVSSGGDSYVVIAQSTDEGFLIQSDFDSQSVGDKPSGWGSTAAKVTNEQSFSGNHSVKCFIPQGDNVAFGEWGGVVSYPNKLFKGDTVWCRIRVFFKSGFQLSEENTALKFIRNRTCQSNGDNRGYNDWYIQKFTGNANPDAMYYCNYEGSNHNSPPLPKDVKERWGDPVADFPSTGVWRTYETEIYLDDKFPSDGGRAVKKRCWIDGELKFESGEIQTLKSASDYMKDAYLFTFWNGTTPVDNTAYIDDVVIRSSTPPNRDSDGNPFIGV